MKKKKSGRYVELGNEVAVKILNKNKAIISNSLNFLCLVTQAIFNGALGCQTTLKDNLVQ